MPFGKQLDGLISKAKVQYDKYQASHQAPPVPPRPNQQYPGQQYQYPGQQYPGQQYQQQQQQQYYPANPVVDASAHYPAAAPHYFPGSHPPQQSSYQRPPPPPPPPQQQYPQYGQPQYSQPQYGQPQYGQPQYGQPPYGQQPYDQQPYEQPQYAQPPYQSPYQPPFQQPPPIPTHPTALPHYWAPILDPSAAVSVNFEHKQGAGGWGNNEAQTYTADARNSFHTPNGALVLRAIADRNAPEGQQYTSARLVSRQPLARDRGFLQVRITAPSAKGIWPAFWLLPREPFTWPGDGEVDIFEAWNGVRQNHACLHWGHFNGEDWNKHRVVETPIPQLDDPNGRWYGFSWDQDGPTGRMVWYVDGMPVMKAPIPPGTRRLADFQIIINIAMGGNVNQNALPEDGQYEMVIHSLKLHEEPSGGWAAFERDWATAAEGRPM
ncbi:Beta-glucanase [Lasiodiplodia hormozganensis]|uniref:Beta-glucanase n=1 Tax=Lasiodiplodia hormozganensis TaxID=869390 RepID=A0AA39XVX4_9PEZI|nr:Beta-glucanase [Lasiodiplodia hormozganensis]